MLESLFKTLALFCNSCGAFDHMLTIFMLYSFLKLLLLSSILELVWPTHFFNKRHNFNFTALKFRNFVEVFLKLKNSNSFLVVLNTFFFSYFLL